MIAFLMSELHQQYSEIMNIPSLDVRGIVQVYTEMKAKQHPSSTQENTGDLPPEDYDTSEWFK